MQVTEASEKKVGFKVHGGRINIKSNEFICRVRRKISILLNKNVKFV